MAVEAAIEALRATLDLVSQTKMGQLFKLLDLLSRLQILRVFFFFFWQMPCAFWFKKHLKKKQFDPSEELLFNFEYNNPLKAKNRRFCRTSDNI